jgi:hypothetical protein
LIELTQGSRALYDYRVSLFTGEAGTMDSPLLNVSDQERERIEALARRRGFDAPDLYLKALIEADAIQHGDEAPFEDDEQVDIREEFRQGWRDIVEGRVYPIDQLWKELDEE